MLATPAMIKLGIFREWGKEKWYEGGVQVLIAAIAHGGGGGGGGG